ncbi:hypothetical protein GYH30_010367 [Glycine max]|nr:hypothetical protein GYH30_010367 [Glycine max]
MADIVVCTIYGSSIPSLVLILARGHRIESILELPLVVSDSAESPSRETQRSPLNKIDFAFLAFIFRFVVTIVVV